MIEIKNLSFGYKKKKEVFSDISLTLREGSIHGLLGCNGVGKSTLMKLLSGLLDPGKGSIVVGGHKPCKRLPSFFREIIFIPEEFDLPHITFDDYIKYNSVFCPGFSKEAIDDYAQKFGIERRAMLDGISMGERKKAYIAFALSCRPRYLLMDEPTNGLDIPAKPVLKAMLASYICADRTVIISTHQVADIQSLLDNVIIMDRTGIIINEPIEEIGRKLSFGPISNDDTVLWEKETLSGRSGVRVNPGNEDSIVDLEMLFNATITNREDIIKIMNR